MIKYILITLLLTWTLSGCTRHYNLYLIGNHNDVVVEVTASVPKTTDVSPTLDLNLVP